MKNKRFLKITLIAVVVALLCAALCGCGLIQGILHPEGKFALSESEITLKIGETYDVTLSNGRTDEFTLSTSDKTKVEIYGRTSIKAVGKTQTAVTITATNGKGDTAELKVNVDYADVSTVKIGVENQYQLLQSGETPKRVDFSATLNDGTNPDRLFVEIHERRGRRSRDGKRQNRVVSSHGGRNIFCHRNGGRKIRNRRILRRQGTSCIS